MPETVVLDNAADLSQIRYGIDDFPEFDFGVHPTITEVRNEILRQIVTGYYRWIDDTNGFHESDPQRQAAADKAMSQIVSMVRDDVLYLRGDKQPIQGVEAWEIFYREQRNPDGSMSGQHRDLKFSVEGDRVAVTGIFNKPAPGAPEGFSPIPFGDFWDFDGLQVIRRETYFAQGANLVEGCRS